MYLPFPRSSGARFVTLAALPCLATGGIVAHVADAGLGLAVGAGSLAAVSGAAWLAVLRPLRGLSARVARPGAARLAEVGPAEIASIAASVNRMRARLTDHEAAAIETDREVDRIRGELEQQPELRREAQLVEEANRRLAARLRELSLVFDITRSLNSTLELGELLRRLTEQVATTLGMAGFAVLLAEDGRRTLHVRAGHGVLPDGWHEGAVLAPGDHAGHEALETGDCVLRRHATVGDRDGSVVAVPMQHKDEVVGVLVFTRPRVDGFAADEIKLLGGIAGQAALAISNARLYEQMVALSITDPLTGVFNRRHLFDHLDMELRRAERYGDAVSVAMIDIDHFKRLNDTWGHAAGDRVLQAVAAALRRCVRRVDTVARFGGEEFCVILPRQGRTEAFEVAEKLRVALQSLELPAHAANAEMPGITASIGVATFPGDAGEASLLLDAADSALYASKRGGRNRSTAYVPGMELHPERRRQITAAEAGEPVVPPRAAS